MIRFICKTQFEDDLTKQKITDIFIVASVDYDKKSEEAYTLFKIVQSKLHYVIYNKFQKPLNIMACIKKYEFRYKLDTKKSKDIYIFW